MKRCLLVSLWLAASMAFGADNLARNPSLEADANNDGVPDEWQCAGDSRLVTQSLTLDKGRDGKRCAKLACTKFAAGNPAAHAMLAQLGIPVKRGANCRVSFWARAESIECDIVSIALSDTSVWASCGLGGAFAPSTEWQRFEFPFQATRDCPAKSRFQLWFGSTGTLWVDDVEFVESGPQALRPGHIIPAAGRKNLIPNASFEVGEAGWGSIGADDGAHWATPMNALFGGIGVGRGFHGESCLAIKLVQPPGAQPHEVPVAFFDYYELTRKPILAPLAANIGWIEVQPGKPYTLSAYLRTDEHKPGVPARLAAREFERGRFDKLVTVSDKWERHSLTFTPRQPWCFVAIGPDLRKSQENPNPPQSAALFLDAIQLEQGGAPSEFTPREQPEFGIVSPSLQRVYGQSEAVHIGVAAVGLPRMPGAALEVVLTDFFGKEVRRVPLNFAASHHSERIAKQGIRGDGARLGA
ncbi:MAG: hypothetical protein FJ290_19895 [Planctomycetes bacterium]|nr:hypothetical protein [Planctomycetota bacterium]